MTTTAPERLRFEVPPERIARRPPEQRGLSRDHVPMLVVSGDDRPCASDRVLADLPRVLRPGDLLVVNTSATRAAALDAVLDGAAVVLHLAGPEPPADAAGRPRRARHSSAWVVEVRRADGTGPILDAVPGAMLRLSGGATATLRLPYRRGPGGAGTRLWLADIDSPRGTAALQRRYGRPISYGADAPRLPLEAYQTVFATTPGSAEMPSAGRPFTPRVITDLVRRGIGVAPVTLHCGVSSQEAGEAPMPERYVVPETTATMVSAARRAGGRVIAVGTTVVRALETCASADGTITGGRGWTDLVLGPERPARVVDGLLSGWHEADASHLDLLQAVAGRRRVELAYDVALRGAYLWHEMGDLCLLLP